MVKKRNLGAALGLLIGLAGVLSYFLWVVPVLSPRLPVLRDWAILNLPIVAIGLVVSGLAVRRALGGSATHRGRFLAPLLGALNLSLASLFLWYLFSFSYHLPAAAGSPQVGQLAPDFTLADQHGQPLHLASLRGGKTLLVFYRGFW